jgi:hypothetical protein
MQRLEVESYPQMNRVAAGVLAAVAAVGLLAGFIAVL